MANDSITVTEKKKRTEINQFIVLNLMLANLPSELQIAQYPRFSY